MTTTAPTPRNYYVSSIRLAAVLTAVSVSRAFIRQTLAAWQLADRTDTAELVASELVTNAVKSTGGSAEPSPRPGRATASPQLIGVQLRLAGAGLYVEVWDRGDGSPAIPRQSPEAEGGRGLFLVDALSERWDIYRPAAGGKVVWSQLALTDRASAWPEGHDPYAKGPFEPVDLALMQRVLSGLRLTSHGGTEAVAV